MAAAWSVQVPPSEKLVLLALADHAGDETFSCWPSLTHLAKKTGLNRRTVTRLIGSLERQMLIGRIHRGQRSTKYQLNVANWGHDDTRGDMSLGAESPPARGTTPLAVGAQCHGGRGTVPHGIIIESSIESLRNRQPTSRQLSKREIRDASKRVLEFLNERAGRQFRLVPTNLEPIQQRLVSGITEADLRKVIVRKCREWKGDEKMARYLRPATLFNRTKCEQYVGELVPPKEASV